MPVNKNALLRYRIIDGCLTNPQRRYPTMEAIKEKIEEQIDSSISDSLFSKDINQMKQMYGAPIKFDRNHKGYYYTEPDFSIKEFPLTHEEIEALDFSTALFHQLKGTRLFQQFESAINKVIEGYRISKIIGKSEMQILQVEEPLKEETNDWIEQILKAIIEGRAITMMYQGYGKEGKEHELSPYLLKEYRNRWYVVGFTNRSEQVLVFSLDRIKNIIKSKSKYIGDDRFHSADFFKYSLGITQLHDATPQTIVLSFDTIQAQYIINQPLHHSQELIHNTEDLVHIQLKLYITQELIMTILAYGDRVEVLKPIALRKMIADSVRKVNKIYN